MGFCSLGGAAGLASPSSSSEAACWTHGYTQAAQPGDITSVHITQKSIAWTQIGLQRCCNTSTERRS